MVDEMSRVAFYVQLADLLAEPVHRARHVRRRQVVTQRLGVPGALAPEGVHVDGPVEVARGDRCVSRNGDAAQRGYAARLHDGRCDAAREGAASRLS
ncbi:hypothetical protein GCM10022225_79920 [Plantactinospora mayteni]|uniref:Uncharacterized protein n=1 Tax=Plantactinospora mayteni TaxID=566021 RepID=A0ABQ4F359_9ACTN|nr:hypothetical protein Pma05_79130 [Plantactinospora mayteni]